jgi:hypothetical protein
MPKFEDPSYLEIFANALTSMGNFALRMVCLKAHGLGPGGLGLRLCLCSCGCSTPSCSRRRLLRRCQASWISPIWSFVVTRSLVDWEGHAPCSKMRSCTCLRCSHLWEPANRSRPAILKPSPPGCGGFSTSPLPIVHQARGWTKASCVSPPCFVFGFGSTAPCRYSR